MLHLTCRKKYCGGVPHRSGRKIALGRLPRHLLLAVGLQLDRVNDITLQKVCRGAMLAVGIVFVEHHTLAVLVHGGALHEVHDHV